MNGIGNGRVHTGDADLTKVEPEISISWTSICMKTR
jgi:hypothetical protein